MKPPACWTRMFIATLTIAVIGCCVATGLAQRHTQNPDQATYDATVYLLKSITRPDQRGEPFMILRALRQLRDPALNPLFKHLAQNAQPSLRIHGILGLAETSADHRINLVRLTELTDPMMQAELIAAAMDSDVISDKQLDQLLNWPGLDTAVRVIAAGPLVSRGKLRDGHALHEARIAENPARRGMAALILTQIGDPSGPRLLDALDAPTPKRESIIQMILASAIRYEFDAIGPWASKWAIDPTLSGQLRMASLQTSLRFGDPAGATSWRQIFESTTDAADRLRLALAALRASPWLEPKFFELLSQTTSTSDVTATLITAIGQTGTAVASKKHIAEAVLALLEHHHPLTDQWILTYAQNHAHADDAMVIFKAFIESFDPKIHRNSPRYVEQVVTAAAKLAATDVQSATRVLRPILADPDGHPMRKKAILLGLLRTSSRDMLAVLPTADELNDSETVMLSALFAARQKVTLTDDQLKKLGLIARGGGGFPVALRVQAAWLYLTQNHRANQALSSILN